MNDQEENNKNQEENNTVENTPIDYGIEIIGLLKEILSVDRLTTYVVNLKDIRIPSTLNILKLNGAGKVTEVAVISTSDFSIYIKADSKELFNKNADYTTLAELGGILNDVDADTSIGNKRVVIRNINFTKNILIQVNSDSEITAENIFCKYDIQNQPPEDKTKKECNTR